VGFSTFNPDYGCPSDALFSCFTRQLVGVVPYADYNHLFNRIGVEGEMRWLNWRGPGSGIKESNYMGGLRVRLITYKKRVSLNAKVLAGDAHFSSANVVGRGNYFAFAPGMTLDYRITRRVAVRADYEYQMWPNFNGGTGGSGGLSPNGLTFGVSYRLLH
jgi:opacity protein-like surface antigen